MKLYIANCSRQTHHFNYKIPEKLQSFGVPIKPGQQHMIEQLPEVIRHIIKQHEPYGFQCCTKVDKHFSGICYSLDKPVTVGGIEEGAEQKTENLENMSQSILEASAISVNKTVDDAVLKSGETPLGDGITMEITGEAVDQEQPNPLKTNKTVKVQK